MMSSSIRTTLAHRVLLAALVGSSLLAVPTAARPQSFPPGGRALLNRFEGAAGHSGPSFTRVPAPIPIDDFSDGERALLNRSPAPDRPLVAQPETGKAGIERDPARAL